jgi:uncharacterized delta-60 repeat protein
MRRIAKYISLVALILWAGTWTVTRGQAPQPGSLDPTFGNAGVAAMDLSPNLIRKVAIQKVGSEDMIVATGTPLTWMMARHRANGALDTSFGVGGVVRKTFKKGSASLDGGVVVQPWDGYLVVAGSVPTGSNAVTTLAVARYTPNGAPDPTFGTNGLVAVAASPDGPGMISRAADLVLQADGKIVVVGNARTADGKECLSVVRLLPGGQLDTTFGTRGLFSYRYMVGFFTGGYAAAIQTLTNAQAQPEDRIVIAGFGEDSFHPALNHDFGMVLRLTTSGALDGTFGTGGIATIEIPSADVSYFRGVAIDSLNRIVAAGYVKYYSGPTTFWDDIVVARFLENGSADPAFNGGALFTQHLSTSVSVYDMAVDPDDRILVAGYRNGFGGTVWRFRSDGSVDSSFGASGMVSNSPGGFWAITLVPGTNMFIVGGSTTVVSGRGSKNYWALWRYFY